MRTRIKYFGQPADVDCDQKCNKAWGINNRPRVQLGQDEDDYEWLSDGELGQAPIDPGTYEGSDAKPLFPDEFPNRWCVRECERCVRTPYKNPDAHLILRDFTVRIRNITKP